MYRAASDSPYTASEAGDSITLEETSVEADPVQESFYTLNEASSEEDLLENVPEIASDIRDPSLPPAYEDALNPIYDLPHCDFDSRLAPPPYHSVCH